MERDLFLSMFNPRYFIDVLGSKGRDLLERYLPEVPETSRRSPSIRACVSASCLVYWLWYSLARICSSA